MLETVNAASNRPIEQASNVTEKIVSLVFGSASDGGIDHGHDIVWRDLGNRPAAPWHDELSTHLALDCTCLALAGPAAMRDEGFSHGGEVVCTAALGRLPLAHFRLAGVDALLQQLDPCPSFLARLF
jgi:hypothetical protein